ncbi:hypothetical protein [Streptosporangium sp. CA-115845]|uniref:hypothetical protein n=1 Tax=Streptosporangium sp. CA-115845 TaxID=3240071 RepID=UPI003D94C2C5
MTLHPPAPDEGGPSFVNFSACATPATGLITIHWSGPTNSPDDEGTLTITTRSPAPCG